MNLKEVKACYTALLGNSSATVKPKLKKFLDAFIEGQIIQLRRDDGSWVDVAEPSFTPDSLSRMRVKPGPVPFGAAAIHKLNGRTVRHTTSGEVRYVFVGTDHQPVFYRKVEKTTAAELLKNWVMASMGPDDGAILGVIPSDKAPEPKTKVKVDGQVPPVIQPTVSDPSAESVRKHPILGSYVRVPKVIPEMQGATLGAPLPQT